MELTVGDGVKGEGRLPMMWKWAEKRAVGQRKRADMAARCGSGEGDIDEMSLEEEAVGGIREGLGGDRGKGVQQWRRWCLRHAVGGDDGRRRRLDDRVREGGLMIGRDRLEGWQWRKRAGEERGTVGLLMIGCGGESEVVEGIKLVGRREGKGS